MVAALDGTALSDEEFPRQGKSSDEGPQAGFVPYLGIYSKVGADAGKAKDGTDANNDGLKHKFAVKVQLALTLAEIEMQVKNPEEVPKRHTIQTMMPVPDSRDFFLFAQRTGDKKTFVFRAVWSGSTNSVYHIWVYPEGTAPNTRTLVFQQPAPLEVMTSSEAGADNKPMTGDYDLMAICPKWGNYGERTLREISKPGLNFVGKGVQPGQIFSRGMNMDAVLGMRTNTGARGTLGDNKKTFQGLTKKDGGKLLEHPDMGNITPRILRCVNTLNAEIGTQGALRRVHHNAESHRNHIFSALIEAEMKKGDGLPLTTFQPAPLSGVNSPVRKYGDVATLETLGEFKAYALLLNEAGYFVPRNWTWGMSIRDSTESLRRYVV